MTALSTILACGLTIFWWSRARHYRTESERLTSERDAAVSEYESMRDTAVEMQLELDIWRAEDEARRDARVAARRAERLN